MNNISAKPGIRLPLLPARGATLLLAVIFLLILPTGCGQPRITLKKTAPESRTTLPFIPASYLLGQGDELEIFYQIDPRVSPHDYVIETEDTLRVDFYYYPVLSKTVRVRPDGFVTLPRVGEIKAAGLRPQDLAVAIHDLYAPHLKNPVVTVDVIEFNAKIEELKKSIYNQERGQSRLAVIRPDGKISLPYVQDIMAAGVTAADLSHRLEQEYRKLITSLSITTVVLNAHSNRVYIMGQVERPNYYELAGAITLTQMVAMAGGFSEDANTHQIVHISWNRERKPQANVFDMDDILGQGNPQADPLISQYDVIYVPRTRLAEAALVGDQLWRLIPLSFTGNANYSLGGKAAN